MSVNSSSISPSPDRCFNSNLHISIYVVFAAVKVVILAPLCTFILHHGIHQWRRQRSFRKQSHSDVFTYHLVIMDLIWILGFVCFLWGEYSHIPPLLKAEISLSTLNLYGEIFFHMLTCVERHLAAVHSITYRRVNIAHGVVVRNASILCVWLLSGVVMISNVTENFEQAIIPFFCVLPFSIITVSFCSLSVLRVLIRPSPGERDRVKGRVDQSKRRAFHTIVSILAALWMWFIGLLVVTSLQQAKSVDDNISCVLDSIVCIFGLPSSLVLPLLYLHRARKFRCFSISA